MSNMLHVINQDIGDLNDRVLDSVVQIQHGSPRDGERRAHGTGAICGADGLIITNAHVVAPMDRRRRHARQASADDSPPLTVVLRSGQELAAAVVAVDTQHDLAALRIEAVDLPALPLGDSRRLRPGELVFALGFPWGLKAGATIGVIIDTGNALPEIGDRQRDWIAASLHLRPGHSGGPMVDSLGRLVGINTIMNGPDVGVAVPAHSVQDFMQRLQRQSPETPADSPTEVVVV